MKTETSEKPDEAAYSYLSRLFKICAPQCTPLPTLMGLCTQIDNLIAGYREELSFAKSPTPPPVASSAFEAMREALTYAMDRFPVPEANDSDDKIRQYLRIYQTVRDALALAEAELRGMK